MTDSDLTPEDIHALGKQEVARIRKELIKAARATDYADRFPDEETQNDDDFLYDFLNYLRTEPRFYFEREEDLLTGYRDICKRIDPWLPTLFRSLPRLTFGVVGNPEISADSDAAGRYMMGNLEAGVASAFVVNTSQLQSRPKFAMIPMALHEAVPGHHLQLALAAESPDIPFFRRGTASVAFVEGWGLYAEGLGGETGMYVDPYDRVGQLLFEVLRACRLVIDPGIHSLGWSREQAKQYLSEHTFLSDSRIDQEVDRYIAMPGQATAYKIGELKIRELRAKAEQELGATFDLRSFHDIILGAGSVPLPALERRVNEWIGSQPRPK